jgi:hypothetical protein
MLHMGCAWEVEGARGASDIWAAWPMHMHAKRRRVWAARAPAWTRKTGVHKRIAAAGVRTRVIRPDVWVLALPLFITGAKAIH